MKRINFEVTEEQHKAIKEKAIKNGLTIKNYCSSVLLGSAVDSEKILNEKIKEIFVELENKKIVEECKFFVTNTAMNMDKDFYNYVYGVVKCYEKKLTSCVYLIFNEENGLYKIGKSRELHKRLKEINSFFKNYCQKSKLKLVAVKPTFEYAAYKLESSLHEKFKSKRVDGEWFNLNENDIDSFLSTYCNCKEHKGVIIDFYATEEFCMPEAKRTPDVYESDLLLACGYKTAGCSKNPFRFNNTFVNRSLEILGFLSNYEYKIVNEIQCLGIKSKKELRFWELKSNKENLEYWETEISKSIEIFQSGNKAMISC